MELKVEGMTCQKCVQHVTRAIHEVDASAQVTIDLATGQVQIQTPQADPQAFAASIEEAGYTVVTA